MTRRNNIRLTVAVTALLTLTCSTGCTTAYWIDRGRDAADIFTLTIGPGIGAQARVGPIDVGLGIYMDGIGLRGGDLHYGLAGEDFASMDMNLLGNIDTFSTSSSPLSRERHKQFDNMGWLCFTWPEYSNRSEALHYLTQIEVCAGALFIGARVGFNPGEFLDFLLGFVGIDLYDDDLERKKMEEVRKAEDELLDRRSIQLQLRPR